MTADISHFVLDLIADVTFLFEQVLTDWRS